MLKLMLASVRQKDHTLLARILSVTMISATHMHSYKCYSDTDASATSNYVHQHSTQISIGHYG